jgi:hypothetical protein
MIIQRKPNCLPQTIAFLFLIIFGTGFKAITNPTIILHDEALSFTPKEFYISNVMDDRADRNMVAQLLKGDQKNVYTADLEGGGITAIKRFISNNLQKNAALRPVVVRLKEFKAQEAAISGALVQGKVIVAMSFYYKRNDEMVHLFDYRGGNSYKRPLLKPIDIEPFLRAGLKNALIYANNWINGEAATNIKLAKGVRISFTDYYDKTEGDTIYYAVNRPLNWDDFKAKPIFRSRYAAEVWPTIGYDEQTEVINGVIFIKLAMKVYLPKSDCWVKDGYRTDYALNHEQRHFDIVKIVGERFKQKMRAEKLLPGNYDGPINVEYLESYREMTNMQKQYDDDTHHGMDQYQQEVWDRRIENDLIKLGIKKNNS